MQNTDTPADMLAVFDTIDPDKEELITPEDRAACQAYQHQCYDVLDELAAMHKYLCKEAEKFTDRYVITFKPNGTVEAQRLSDCKKQDNFINVRFLPFKFINDIAEKYHHTCGLFENLIVGYFVDKYHFTIAYPFSETDNIALGYRPDYNLVVDYVISQLGGLTFREKAEEEIIQRVLKTVGNFGRGVQPECQGDKIRFFGITEMDDYELKYGNYQIAYGSDIKVANLCAGLALFAEESIQGGMDYIRGFDHYRVQVGKWYELPTDKLSAIRFYVNGRIDVRFPNPATAAACFHFLRLYSIEKS